MITTIEQASADAKISRQAIARPASGVLMRLSPRRLGLAFGGTGAIFYLGCMLTMATVPREKAVLFFNSLWHGLNVEPILQTSVPIGEALLGLVTTFILGWFAGALIAGFYNLALGGRVACTV